MLTSTTAAVFLGFMYSDSAFVTGCVLTIGQVCGGFAAICVVVTFGRAASLDSSSLMNFSHECTDARLRILPWVSGSKDSNAAVQLAKRVSPPVGGSACSSCGAYNAMATFGMGRKLPSVCHSSRVFAAGLYSPMTSPFTTSMPNSPFSLAR